MVSFYILPQLGYPVVLIGFRSRRVFRTGVPKATVDEYGDQLFRKCYVWVDYPASIEMYGEIFAETESLSVKG